MARKKHAEEHENLERWLVSYADFITLLFAFFTVLYALGQTDKANYQKAVKAIERAFMNSGGVFPMKGSPLSPMGGETQGAGSAKSAGEGGTGSANEGDMEALASQVRGLFERATGVMPDANDVEVVRSDEGYRIRLGEALVFNPNSDKLKRSSIAFVYELGKRVSRLNLPVQIEGHTDSDEQSAAKQDNPWQLSLSRATNIGKFFIEATGMPANRISIAAHGDSQPLTENTTAEGRIRNRRVEITITTPDKTLPSLW